MYFHKITYFIVFSFNSYTYFISFSIYTSKAQPSLVTEMLYESCFGNLFIYCISSLKRTSEANISIKTETYEEIEFEFSK